MFLFLFLLIIGFAYELILGAIDVYLYFDLKTLRIRLNRAYV